MAESDNEAKHLESNQLIRNNVQRIKAIFANRNPLSLGEKLLLILAEELFRWLMRG